MQSGLGHQGGPSGDGVMAVFCPACPQPGINLPEDWKIKYNEYGSSIVCSNILLTHSYTHSKQLICTFIMDGNFSAEHMKSRSGAPDAPLSAGMAFMANPEVYKAHMDSAKVKESKEVCTGPLSVDGSQLMSS